MRNDSGLPEISVAPMMDWTDRDCRYFMRLLSPGIRLYTEMVTARAILHGPYDRLLAFDPAEHPVALQLGGSVPAELGRAAALARERYPYDEINLNVGCPSDRVQSGRFGACLMAEPALVADCVHAIKDNWPGRVSVKTRIGIDDLDTYDFLADFVETVSAAGCQHFIVHARKAILSGLSPKENRSIPPLDYPRVWRLASDFPGLHVVINGGLADTGLIDAQLERVDGVMLGRKAYSDPFFLVTLQNRYLGGFGGKEPTREGVLREMAAYARRRLGEGGRLVHLCRHLLGLYSGQPHAARWRRFIAESSRARHAEPEILLQSLQVFDQAA